MKKKKNYATEVGKVTRMEQVNDTSLAHSPDFLANNIYGIVANEFSKRKLSIATVKFNETGIDRHCHFYFGVLSNLFSNETCKEKRMAKKKITGLIAILKMAGDMNPRWRDESGKCPTKNLIFL